MKIIKGILFLYQKDLFTFYAYVFKPCFLYIQ